MSDDRGPARLPKWPFYVADLLLSAVIIFVLYQLGAFEGTTDMVIVTVCIAGAAIAAWISILPWLKEHQASVRLSDTSNLKTSLEQIKSVEKVADLIRQSNAQWQSVQDASARTVASAREITEKMRVEAEEFMKFIAQAHGQERAGLRLEVEKLRRMEGDWIKVSVQILDHIFALTRAAERSGQAQLIRQLHQFQNACRDVARRMGLATFVPTQGEPYDERAHQLPNSQTAAQEGDKVQDVLASGFTYQGQLLRRSLVVLDSAQQPEGLPPQELQNEPNSEPEAAHAADEDRETGTDAAQLPPAEADLEGDQNYADSPENFEEPPAIIDTFPSREHQEPLEPDAQSATEKPAESLVPEPDTQPIRTRKRSGQEELPF